MLEHHHLFKARNPDRELDDAYHLAEMHAVLGAPPLEFLTRSDKSFQFWDKDGRSYLLCQADPYTQGLEGLQNQPGKWKGMAPVPDCDLEALEARLEGEERDDFLRFLRRMLCWLPEQRATAKELIYDPWLMYGLFK